MTVFYVSKNGSDSNNGLGPDASHATNKPWLTVGKALGHSAVAGISSGDTCYVAPGVYREEIVVGITSPTVETLVRGDVANAQGFKDGSGVRLAAGEVRVTAYTSGDTAAPASSPVSLSGRDWLTFEDMILVGGSASAVFATTATSQHITFRRCLLVSQNDHAVVLTNSAAAQVFDWLLENCVVFSAPSANCVRVTFATSSAGADYDGNVVIRNCLLMTVSTIAVNVLASGALAFEGNGVHLRNCTVFGTTGFSSSSASLSNTVANTIYNCLFFATSGMVANAAGGLITEDYNRTIGPTPRTNVTGGAHSVEGSSTHSNLLELGQSALLGMRPRPLFAPSAGSPTLGFGNTSGTSSDLLGVPRPSGGASALPAVGAHERANSWGKETTTVRTGTNALSVTGPAVQDFELPVDAVATTVTAYVRWDSTYAGTKPQLKVLVGSEAGVSDATATAAGSANSWEQLSLNFTPARAGIVTVRLQANDTNGAGKTFADDWAVA